MDQQAFSVQEGTDGHWLMRTLLGSAAASHLLLGIMALGGKSGQQVFARIYGATTPISDQLGYSGGLVGGYFISLGGMLTLAIADPRRYKGVIDFFLLIYVLNTYHRVLNYKEAERVFGIRPQSLFARMAFLDTVGLLIFRERLKLR